MRIWSFIVAVCLAAGLVGCRGEQPVIEATATPATDGVRMFGVGLGDDLKTLPPGKIVEKAKEGDGLVLVDSYKGVVAEIGVDGGGRVERIESEMIISIEKDGIPWLMDADDYDIVVKKLEGVDWADTEDGIEARIDEETVLKMFFTQDPRFFVSASLERPEPTSKRGAQQ